ncbi:MAG: zinc transporter ZntB [Deltaproteobacteria bacterium]|nr:zinc transporter ZntB [Deltaproteobacteria bacterium]
MSTDPGLLHAYILDGKGRGKKLDDLAEVLRWKPIDGVLWINLDYATPEAAAWLTDHSNVDPVMREALTDNDPRPRVTLHGDDLLVITRGINLNQGSEPEDMISIRIYVERERIITLRHRPSRTLKLLAADLERGKGPKDAPDLLVQLVDRIVDGVVTRVDNLSDAIAALEDQVLTEARPGHLRSNIADHRRRAIALRRFLAPQREAFVKLSTITLPWFAESHREQFVESADRMTRSVEELDAARDRASVTQEELSSRMGELTNQRLYVLSMITAVFLPLGFVCGLLGVNVGGVPFKEDDWAFWVLCSMFLVGVGIQLWIFRKRGWM